MRREIVQGVAAAAVLAAAAGGVGMAMAAGFDPAGWKAAAGSAERDNPRNRMVSDLKTRLKPGMSRSEVTDLLGKPDAEAAGRLTWDLGMSRYGVDYEYFVIELDPQEHVRSFRLQRG